MLDFDIQNVIAFKYGEYDWMCGETYESLDWFDVNDRPKPTLEEVKEAAKEYKAYQKSIAHRAPRANEMPNIGDQLDAILKQLNYMQMSGKQDLIEDMDDIIGQWLAVKRKYPKE